GLIPPTSREPIVAAQVCCVRAPTRYCPGSRDRSSRSGNRLRRAATCRQGQSMPDKIRIALDVMGGDAGASVVVPGAALSLIRHPDMEFVLFGDTRLVAPLVDAQPHLKAASRLVHTDVAVKMDDKPSQALRHGRWKSSM